MILITLRDYWVEWFICPCLTSQKARVYEEEPASIKAEVDKILSKFKTLKVFNIVYFCLSHGKLSFLTLIMRSRIG